MPTPARVVVVPQEPGPLTVEQVELPDPGPHQVVVRQYASGICHSQLHEMHRERRTPVILGHESTGIVLQTGAEVSHVEPGDTVLVTWVPRDVTGTDRPTEGVTLDLPDGRQAVTNNVFTWADHTIADEQYVVKVSPDIDKEVTCIIGCAVMTGAGAVEKHGGSQSGRQRRHLRRWRRRLVRSGGGQDVGRRSDHRCRSGMSRSSSLPVSSAPAIRSTPER